MCTHVSVMIFLRHVTISHCTVFAGMCCKSVTLCAHVNYIVGINYLLELEQ